MLLDDGVGAVETGVGVGVVDEEGTCDDDGGGISSDVDWGRSSR